MLENKNYEEYFVVGPPQNNNNTTYTNFQSMQFNTYEEALAYINDMLKYHTYVFQINKLFRKKK